MIRRTVRLNARLLPEQYDRIRELLASRKLFGCYTLTDIVNKGIEELWRTFVGMPLERQSTTPVLKVEDMEPLAGKYDSTIVQQRLEKEAAKIIRKRGKGKKAGAK